MKATPFFTIAVASSAVALPAWAPAAARAIHSATSCVTNALGFMSVILVHKYGPKLSGTARGCRGRQEMLLLTAVALPALASYHDTVRSNEMASRQARRRGGPGKTPGRQGI